MKRTQVVEKHETTVDTGDLRRAISALSNAANIAAEALKEGQQTERHRSRQVISECTAGLAALAFAQIPKERR